VEAVEDGQWERDSFDDVPRDGATHCRVNTHVLRTFHLEQNIEKRG